MTKNLEVLINAYKESVKDNEDINLGEYLINGNIDIFKDNDIRNELSKIDNLEVSYDVKISILKSLIYSIDTKKVEEAPLLIKLLSNSVTQLNDIDSNLDSSICFFNSDGIIEILENDYNIDGIVDNIYSGKYDYSDILKIRIALMEIKRLENRKYTNKNKENKKVI